MAVDSRLESISIRPGVSILSVLRHLNYKPWYALAEFVDNSLQSFLSHREALTAIEGPSCKLHVTIEIDSTDDGRIIIRDDAAGIHEADYPRAFRPAELPTDRSGLSEFGMGMKSAACWFARRWSVRTKALGETAERIVSFDIEPIVRDGIEALDVQTRSAAASDHYTEIVLSGLHSKVVGRTIGKIREHLASIYRVFLRNGVLELRFATNGYEEYVAYQEPQVLRAPHYKAADGVPKVWRKDIDLDLPHGRRVRGFAALRETGSTSGAGFALFRRGRLIQGSADEGYRPEEIFGRSNSFTYQRLFGELHLDGFKVSHTKDGFQWDDDEEFFLELLKEQIKAEPLSLLDQADGYRVRPKPEEIRSAAELAAQRTAETIERKVPRLLEEQLQYEPESTGPPSNLPVASTAAKRVIRASLHDRLWEITLELSDDPAVGDWVSVFDRTDYEEATTGDFVRHIGVRVSLAHPFSVRFGGTASWEIEPLLRLAVAIGLAETAARHSGVKHAGTIRRNVNELLRNALSEP
jgi:hypothetical protein